VGDAGAATWDMHITINKCSTGIVSKEERAMFLSRT